MKNVFRLGHNYDVSEYYKDKMGDFTSCAKYYICADVYDFHVYRIIVGYNSEYEKEPRTKLIELHDISKRDVLEAVEKDLNMTIAYRDIRDFPKCLTDVDYENMGFKSVIRAVVGLDNGDNDDLKEYRYDTPIENLINDIDAGYGITILDVNLDKKVD